MIKLLENIDDIFRVLDGPVRQWRFITLHHTADLPSNLNHAGEWLDEFHRHNKGWENGMGYHFCVNWDGKIEYGDRWHRQLDGAHNYGYNKFSIGIVMAGNYSNPGYRPPKEQIESVRRLISKLGLRVYPHRAFHDTECPGLLFNDLKVWFNLIDRGWES